jgi:hypothetical protein
MYLFVNNMADPDISDYECDAEFPDVDSEDSEGKETDKDITGTDIESQNHEADAAAYDVLPVQIERRFNKLNTLIVHSLTPIPFFLSLCIHFFFTYKVTDHLT